MDRIPRIGFGLWKVAPQDCARVIAEAIDAGYRHFDCAADYGNEAEVGAALADAIAAGKVTRDELWITSKLWNTYHHPDHVRAACERSLSDLRLDYLDLYLVHFPIALEFVPFETAYPPEWRPAPGEAMRRAAVPLHLTWAAMEELTQAGLTRRIGVCNYNSALVHDLMAYARVKPAMLQIEAHPYLTQTALIRTARDYDIDVTAFSPLGSLSYLELDMAKREESLLDQPAICEAATRTGKTPAQVVLRWGLQRGTALIPKSANPGRMRENLAIDGFEVTDDEMAAISALDRHRRFNDPGAFAEGAFGTFHAIYD